MNTTIGSDSNEANGKEWTVVHRGKGRIPKRLPYSPGFDKDLTLGKLLADYERRLQIWRASTCRRQVRQILDRKKPEGGWQIKHAVCLASGSFCRDNWECQRRSITQFAAFMDIVAHLQVTSDDRIGIFAQELVFAPLDIEFLTHLNVTAYHDPAIGQSTYKGASAKDYIDRSTFVFEPFMEKFLPTVRRLLTSDVKLLVGTDAPGMDASKTSAGDYRDMRALYEQFNAGYSSYDFPTFEEDPNVFQGLRISWKESTDENNK